MNPDARLAELKLQLPPAPKPAGVYNPAVRVGNMLSELAYVQAVRAQAQRAGVDAAQTRTIPLPGLPSALSQLAVPIIARETLLGVLCLQSEVAGRFTARDEAAAGFREAWAAGGLGHEGSSGGESAAPR